VKLISLQEPELEFGGSQSHIDIRFGLRDFGPLDLESTLAPKVIRVGIVGSSTSVEAFQNWLSNCRNGIPAKSSNKPYLFPEFPSLDGKSGFQCEFLLEKTLNRTLTRQELLKIALITSVEERIIKAVSLFADQIEHLSENAQPNVVVCAFPEELIEILDDPKRTTAWNFHDLLKARVMTIRVPIQIVLPSLSDESKVKIQKKSGLARTLQDQATRAWNIYSALYYKAGGTPWRLKRESTALDTCFVGISFFRTLDGTAISTSIAQVFNERGEGVVVRGAAAQFSKEDKQPHLSEEDSFELLVNALQRYKMEHKNLPARVVLHKSSSFSEEEMTGFQQALADAEISIFDMLHLRPSDIRLYRAGVYPPLRGTVLELDDETFIIYTRGSVPFFQTYPGMYVPRPLMATVAASESTTASLAREVLALTKLNWNSTQFDGADPITVRASHEVGSVLRFCTASQIIAPRYSYYM
jgi:hypothetical protein